MTEFEIPRAAQQQSLFAAEAARDVAIRKVEYGKEDFVKVALEVVQEIAATREEFTTDALWDELERREIPVPPEARVLGAVMRKASRLGIAVPTGRTRKSRRPECHARPMQVWRGSA